MQKTHNTKTQKEREDMSLSRFLEIWNFQLNESNYRYENSYLSIDYLFVKYHEKKGDLKDLSFELLEMGRPTLKDMD